MSSERGVNYDLVIAKGKTLTRTLRAGARPFIYKAISGITQAAPARVTTAAAHGLPDGWPVAVVSVLGMRQINAENDPPLGSEYHQATLVDTTHVDLNDVNAAGFSLYTSGGYLQFFTPTDLAGAEVRLTIKDEEGGTALIELDSSGNGITLNNTTKTITITIDADATAAINWDDGVYDAEIEFADGTVRPLAYGVVTVEGEVTT